MPNGDAFSGIPLSVLLHDTWSDLNSVSTLDILETFTLKWSCVVVVVFLWLFYFPTESCMMSWLRCCVQVCICWWESLVLCTESSYENCRLPVCCCFKQQSACCYSAHGNPALFSSTSSSSSSSSSSHFLLWCLSLRLWETWLKSIIDADTL